MTVMSEVTGGVVTTGDKVAVVDKGTNTAYNLSQGKTIVARGASFTTDKVGTYTYKLKTLSDRISIDTQGTISGLTLGEKVIVTNTDGETLTYEVSGDTLLINKTTNTGTTIINNKLAEGETDGFIILQGKLEAVNRSTDSSVMQTEVGLEVSSNPIESVTGGRLLGRNGQATNAEDKAIATVTINSDDTLKYQAKEDKAQDVKVYATSKKTWDITTSKGKPSRQHHLRRHRRCRRLPECRGTGLWQLLRSYPDRRQRQKRCECRLDR